MSHHDTAIGELQILRGNWPKPPPRRPMVDTGRVFEMYGNLYTHNTPHYSLRPSDRRPEVSDTRMHIQSHIKGDVHRYAFTLVCAHTRCGGLDAPWTMDVAKTDLRCAYTDSGIPFFFKWAVYKHHCTLKNGLWFFYVRLCLPQSSEFAGHLLSFFCPVRCGMLTCFKMRHGQCIYLGVSSAIQCATGSRLRLVIRGGK